MKDIYIINGMERAQNFSGGAVCLVLASNFYDESDYIRDYHEFIKNFKSSLIMRKIFRVSFSTKNPNDINKSILKVSDSSQFIGGKRGRKFEKEYSNFLNIKETIAVGNGYDALVLSLRVLGISNGDEVLVPSNTFIATWLW